MRRGGACLQTRRTAVFKTVRGQLAALTAACHHHPSSPPLPPPPPHVVAEHEDEAHHHLHPHPHCGHHLLRGLLLRRQLPEVGSWAGACSEGDRHRGNSALCTRLPRSPRASTACPTDPDALHCIHSTRWPAVWQPSPRFASPHCRRCVHLHKGFWRLCPATATLLPSLLLLPTPTPRFSLPAALRHIEALEVAAAFTH